MVSEKIKQQFYYWFSVVYDSYCVKKGYFVIGYTKSGTNWLRNLIRYYYEIDLPEKDNSFFRQRVHHMHRFVPASYFKKKSVYMVRDGRDTIVSRYFTMIKQPSQQLMKRDFIKYSNVEPTSENIKELLPLYIEFLKTYHKSTIDYSAHVKKALKDKYFIIKYEDLLDNTADTLSLVLSHFNPEESINIQKVKDVIEFSSFDASKKRQKKESGFFRKDGGKSGGWKDYFTTQSANVYNNYAGDLLIKFGYESNANWVEGF